MTTGTPQRFSSEGVYGEIERVLYPVERLLLQYMGFEVLPPFVAYAAPRVSDAERQAYLRAWKAVLLSAMTRPVERFKRRSAEALAAVGSAAWGRQA